MMYTMFPRLFEPGRLGRLVVKNRIVLAPMGIGLAADTGGVSDKTIDYYAEIAKGGTGLLITQACSVATLGDAPTSAHLFRLDSARYISGHGDLVEAVHSYDAAIALQIYHPGRLKMIEPPEGWELVAPSAFRGRIGEGWPFEINARAMTVEEIHYLVEKFADTAFRARRAGYDAVEVHGAHGYLICQFMMRCANQRTDQYGGSLENRARFAIEIVRRIKERVGKEFPVIFRLTALAETEYGEGYSLEEGKLIAKLVEAAGADALHITMGTANDPDGVGLNVCPQSFAQGWRVPYAEEIKHAVKIPVIAVGKIQDPEFAEGVLEAGKVDFVALGRQLLADPEWPKKAAAGKVEDIRKCLSCNYCAANLGVGRAAHCSINASLGREREFRLTPASVSKRVMVVGAGPAGMEAARVAALRGHKVSLYEKGSELGDGQLKLTWVPPHKERMRYIRDYLGHQLNQLGVRVHLNCDVDEKLIEASKPEVLIIATGAKPLIPEIPGIHGKNVFTAHDVLGGKVKIKGERVAVLGQLSTGAETAEFLAERGNTVTIVARSSARYLGRGANLSNLEALRFRLRKNKSVTILNLHDVKEISSGKVVLVDESHNERVIEVDKVVLSRGVVPVNELAQKLRGRIPETYVIGDAKEPRNIAAAIYEGALVARRI